MKVYFTNYKNAYIKHKIKKILNFALQESDVKYSGFYVNITFTDAKSIKELNKQYRDINKETDVLSFPMVELNKGKNFELKKLAKEINPQNGLINLGDIIICKEIAKTQAENLGHSLKREICFLVLHGFLHLLGFDHDNEQNEFEMNCFAEKTLNFNKVKRV